jgi:hypothetical protein
MTQRGAPAPPAVTRPVRTAGMGGTIRPPYMPRHDGRTSYAAPEPPATSDPADDMLADAAGWPNLPEQGAAVPAWGTQADQAEDGTEARNASSHAPADADSFPLDAFFVPPDAPRSPNGYDATEHDAVSERIASRLEDLARFIRSRGVAELSGHETSDELTRLVAAVVTGFVTRET